jgi:hypothetical protein
VTSLFSIQKQTSKASNFIKLLESDNNTLRESLESDGGIFISCQEGMRINELIAVGNLIKKRGPSLWVGYYIPKLSTRFFEYLLTYNVKLDGIMASSPYVTDFQGQNGEKEECNSPSDDLDGIISSWVEYCSIHKQSKAFGYVHPKLGELVEEKKSSFRAPFNPFEPRGILELPQIYMPIPQIKVYSLS